MRLLIGAFLLAAPAAAQRVVLPVEAVRTAPFAPVIAPAPSLTAPTLLPSLIPSAPALAPVPAAPAAIKLPAVAAAVAQFQTLDLKAAAASDARCAGDALMARALGAEPGEAAALAAGEFSAPQIPLDPPSSPEAARPPRSGPSVHLLSKPLHETVELGPTARVLHYALETALQFVKAALVWHATGSPAAGLGVLAFEAVKIPPMITIQSLMDLGLRYWWRKLSTLRRLADTPGAGRIRVLTTGETRFSGVLARKQENTGLIFMDGDGALPAQVSGFGAPIPVENLAERRVRMTLVHHGSSDPTFWLPTLGELLEGRPMPAHIAESWRERLDADKKHMSPLRRLFDFSKEKELKVEARLSDGAGGETELGSVAFGRSVKRLVGLGTLDRVRAVFGGKPAARAIPISDTTVERGGRRLVEGFWRRAWGRLSGRLIVRP